MPLASGLASQLGIVDEVTYGTPVTVTRFYDFVPENVNLHIDRIEAKGLRAAARTIKSAQWVAGKRWADGPVDLEVWNKGYGLWLKHCLGAVTSTQPNVGTDSTVWDHTFTPGDLAGKSLTMQIGRASQDGTVRAFTYKGVKIQKWELALAVDKLAELKVTTIGADEDTTIALAAATAPTGLAPFAFTQGTLSVAGSAIDVHDVKLSGDNFLNDRFKLGTALRKEPLEAARRDYIGEITAYFVDFTAYNRFVNGTEAALVFDVLGGVIPGGSGTFNFELKITANVRFDGDTPNVTGPGEAMQALKVKCTDAGSGALTVLYRTTDTTP